MVRLPRRWKETGGEHALLRLNIFFKKKKGKQNKKTLPEFKQLLE